MLVSLKHLTTSAAAEGKGQYGQRDTEIQEFQPEEMELHLSGSTSSPKKAECRQAKRGRCPQDMGVMEFGGTAGARGQREGPGSLAQTTHGDKGAGSQQANWGEGGTDTTLAPWQAGVTQQQHMGFPGVKWNTRSRDRDTNSGPSSGVTAGAGDLKYWNKKNG